MALQQKFKVYNICKTAAQKKRLNMADCLKRKVQKSKESRGNKTDAYNQGFDEPQYKK